MQEQLISDFLIKYGIQDIHLWNDKEFDKASDVLFQETGIRISINTLKRLLGKIKTEKAYKPQSASLNALAKYLGYSSFHEYKKQSSGEPSIKLSTREESHEPPKRNYIKAIIGVIIIFGSSVLAFLYTKKDTTTFEAPQHINLAESNQEAIIKVNPLSSTKASKVDFVYEVPSELYSMDKGEFVLSGKSYPLQQSRTIVSDSFSTPGIYRGKVIVNKKMIQSNVFSILTDGWVFLNGSKEFNDENRGSNHNVKVEANLIKDFYIPDDKFLLHLQYDSLMIPKEVSNQLKIKLKLVFDHEEAFFVFYGDDVLNKSPFTSFEGMHYPDIGEQHTLDEGLPINIRIEGNKESFVIELNDKIVSKFPKKKALGDLRMIGYESRRVKLTLNKFTVENKQGGLSYDLLTE